MPVLFLLFCVLFNVSVFAQEEPSPSETLRHTPPGEGEGLIRGPVEGEQAANGVEGPRRLELEDLVIAQDLEDGLIVVIADPYAYLGTTIPTGRFGRGEVWTELVFRDDGTSPDGAPLDRQYVAWSPLPTRGGMTEIRLYGAQEILLYTDARIPLPWEREDPTIALMVMEDGEVIPTIETNDHDASLLVSGTEESDGRGEFSPPNDGSGRAVTDAGTFYEVSESGERTFDETKLWLVILLSILGCAVLILGFRIRRSSAFRLVPVGSAEKSSLLHENSTPFWILKDHRTRLDVIVALARGRHRAGHVLICAQIDSRDVLRKALRGCGSISWATKGSTGFEALSGEQFDWGRGLIIIEGPESVETGDVSDWRTRAIQVPTNWDVCVLLIPSDGPIETTDRVMGPVDLAALGVRETGNA